jgi:molybdenum cofactor biosynthesis protein B
MSAEDHERHARAAAVATPIRLAIITVSDTRSADSDPAGDIAEEIAAAGGVIVTERRWVRDDPDSIGLTLDALLDDVTLDAVVSTGGTGLGPRDGTIDVVRRRLRLELPGFGEQVRSLGWRDVGASTMLSRAIGGVASGARNRGILVFAMPGSPRAVHSVMQELVIPVLPHAIWELRGRPSVNEPRQSEVD